MALRFRQQGMTPLAVAGLLGLLAFAVLIVLTIAPIYIENFNVKSHVKRVGADSSVASMSKEEIVTTLLKRFDIDDVKNVKREDIFVSENNGKYLVEVDYEVRKNFVSNIDIVIFFNEKTEIGK